MIVKSYNVQNACISEALTTVRVIPRGLTVQQKRYRPIDSYKNLDIKFNYVMFNMHVFLKHWADDTPGD
jgi:hypothetical protein